MISEAMSAVPFNRDALEDLIVWKEKTDRKPLLLRGARQVGKSTLVKMFSTQFEYFIELNLEEYEVQDIFNQRIDFEPLLDLIFIYGGLPAGDSECLIFIDEIQESPEAIRMLRFFYERRPDLYVIAAGSLLEFAIDKVPSFPVGRVEYYYLHPLSFKEYLQWTGNERVAEALARLPFPNHLSTLVYQHFHQYLTIGGLPQIVANYARNGLVAEVLPLYTGIWQSYEDDVRKYGRDQKEQRVIYHVIKTAHKETDRIKFEGFAGSSYKSREVGEALRTLDLAKIIRLIYPTTKVEPPIISDTRRRPRLQFLDTGLLNYALDNHPQLLSVKDFGAAYKGRILQHMLYQQLIGLHNTVNYDLNFWVRENANTNAEVDLVYRWQEYVLPIEIKSGAQGRLRSLHQFVERSPHPYAIRLLKNNFSVEQYDTPGGTPYLLMNLPYFLMGRIKEYVAYFVTHYALGKNGKAVFDE